MRGRPEGSPIRVLRVIARLNMGGPALHVTYLARGLASRGYETTLVAGDVARGEESMAFVAERAGVEIVPLPGLSRELSPLRDAVAAWRVAKDPSAEPTVALVVAAYNEEEVIERRLENLLALDYPADRLELVVASDASTDRTNELVEAVAAREPRVRLLDCPRGGKVAAQDRAVRETESDVVAFSDANSTWSPDALSRLVANLADPEVAYVCGRLRLEEATGSNREGLYWRYELWLREQESRLGSVTGGNGAIYALRRGDYVEVDPRWGHDLSLPYRMVQAGRRAVYEPAALAFERPTPTNEAEHARKLRMFEHCWEITLRGSMLRRLPRGYLASVVSHRVLRYSSGLLHIVLLATSVVLAPAGWPYALALLGQLAVLAAFAAGVPLARYYVYVTWATVEALWNYLLRGVPAAWDPAATR
jgi:cellulose synthase/poly-beta-1,6-N-acetylglucosamine synthase-like glycosyltransferase